MFLRKTLLLLSLISINHCGSAGIPKGDANGADPLATGKDPKNQGPKDQSLNQVPEIIQGLYLDSLAPTGLPERECPLTPVAALSKTGTETWPKLDMTGDAPAEVDITSYRMSRDGEQLVVSTEMLNPIPSPSDPGADLAFEITIDGIVAGRDGIRSSRLNTFVLNRGTLREVTAAGLVDVEPSQWHSSATGRSIELSISAARASQFWNWPIWAIRLRTGLLTNNVFHVADDTGWSAFTSELGQDLSSSRVSICSRKIQSGKRLDLYMIEDVVAPTEAIRSSARSAYTYLQQIIDRAALTELPANSMIWLMGNRANSSWAADTSIADPNRSFTFLPAEWGSAGESGNPDGPSRFLEFIARDFHLRQTYTFFPIPDSHLARDWAESFALASVRQILGFASFAKESRREVATRKNDQGLGLLLSSVLTPYQIFRVAAQKATSVIDSEAETFANRLAERTLASATSESQAAAVSRILPGWIRAGDRDPALSVSQLGDQDGDGIIDAQETLLGSQTNSSHSFAKEWSDLAQFSWAKRPQNTSVVPIANDGSPSDWQILVPSLIQSDKDESFGGCQQEANISGFSGLIDPHFLALAALTKGAGPNANVQWKITLKIKDRENAVELDVATGGQEVHAVIHDDKSTREISWLMPTAVQNGGWELFIPRALASIPAQTKAEDVLVHMESRSNGKLCDDSPWFAPLQVKNDRL